MSSLTEQERIGLEEVFLSISSSRTLLQKISFWRQNVSMLFKSNRLSTPWRIPKKSNFWIKSSLKKDKIKKLWTKMEKRRKI